MQNVNSIEILLVEDNKADIDLTFEMFEEAKFKCNLNAVIDGEEALKYLRKQEPYAGASRPDVVLLDLNMPKMDGRATLKEIKADEDLRRIPVVILTSSEAEQDIVQSYNLHANAYVTKPVGLEELSKLVNTFEEFWFTIVKLPPK